MKNRTHPTVKFKSVNSNSGHFIEFSVRNEKEELIVNGLCKLKVIPPDGKTFTNHAVNYQDLKQNVYDEFGIPPCQQFLETKDKKTFNLICPEYPWEHTKCKCKKCNLR